MTLVGFFKFHRQCSIVRGEDKRLVIEQFFLGYLLEVWRASACSFIEGMAVVFSWTSIVEWSEAETIGLEIRGKSGSYGCVARPRKSIRASHSEVKISLSLSLCLCASASSLFIDSALFKFILRHNCTRNRSWSHVQRYIPPLDLVIVDLIEGRTYVFQKNSSFLVATFIPCICETGSLWAFSFFFFLSNNLVIGQPATSKYFFVFFFFLTEGLFSGKNRIISVCKLFQ